MATILFDKIVYGPVHSRRLGVSLGINLFPKDGKLCTFNCIYCECGYNEDHRTRTPLPKREEVKEQLTKKLELQQKLLILINMYGVKFYPNKPCQII